MEKNKPVEKADKPVKKEPNTLHISKHLPVGRVGGIFEGTGRLVIIDNQNQNK